MSADANKLRQPLLAKGNATKKLLPLLVVLLLSLSAAMAQGNDLRSLWGQPEFANISGKDTSDPQILNRIADWPLTDDTWTGYPNQGGHCFFWGSLTLDSSGCFVQPKTMTLYRNITLWVNGAEHFILLWADPSQPKIVYGLFFTDQETTSAIVGNMTYTGQHHLVAVALTRKQVDQALPY